VNSKNLHPKVMPSSRVLSVWELTTHRLSLVRALYIVTVASNGPREALDAEFRQAIGDALEGVALSLLTLNYIDRDKVREEASWLQERK
jgi:hypothetical protein